MADKGLIYMVKILYVFKISEVLMMPHAMHKYFINSFYQPFEF